MARVLSCGGRVCLVYTYAIVMFLLTGLGGVLLLLLLLLLMMLLLLLL